MRNSKDIMPLWGPYSKKYMGISHVADSLSKMGARFDFIVHPTLWNSAFPPPNVTFPSGYHLWHCREDYSFYAYRCELMWKDQIYCDVSFSRMDSDSYLVRCEFINHTDLRQNCLINAYSALEFPHAYYCRVSVPSGTLLIDARDYSCYEYATPRPWDQENPDGMHKGEFADFRFLNGFGLGDRCQNDHVPSLHLKPFGEEKGDLVSYDVCLDSFQSPVVTLRYRTVSDHDAVFSCAGQAILLPASQELRLVSFAVRKDLSHLTLQSLGDGGVELDFLAITEKGQETEIETSLVPHGFVPQVSSQSWERGRSVRLHYPETHSTYYILTHHERTRERVLDSGCLEDALPNRLSNGDPTYDTLQRTFSGSFQDKKSDEGFFHNVLIRSIYLAPHSRHTEYMVISTAPITPLSDAAYEEIYHNARPSDDMGYNESGKPYTLSTRILKATLLTNVVYPVYRHGKWIIHFTPGKRWDSLYTWDSGLIGIGMLEFSPAISRYILETYLSEEDNPDFAFLLHGSLVPTQFAQYFEMLQRENDKTSLLSLYPRMMRYYRFLTGAAGSTTAKFQNGLFSTYDYWYSCSGMDDYPAQMYMIARQMMHCTCPCISTAQILRAAKILRMAATALGLDDDVRSLTLDIERSSEALNTLAWDEEAGYYSYTVYDEDHQPPRFLRNETGENMNKGMDGIYPLIAGVVPPDRTARLLSHLKNPQEMWSPSGISAVDMSASYYFDDGYWNGNVWMAHQWFIWKTMLDLGETDFAYAIARRALDLWKTETDFSYNTYECFGIETGRGGWFHQFGGLSSPICVWANAYYKPGTVTTGFDLWLGHQETTPTSADLRFRYDGNADTYAILLCLSDQHSYTALLNDAPYPCTQREAGMLEITLSHRVKEGHLRIIARS